MRGQVSMGVRWAGLTVILMLAALLPSNGIIAATRTGASASLLASALPAPNPAGAEPAAATASPTPTAKPPAFVALLTHPAPSAPAGGAGTYIPILYYHYIRVNPVARDRVGVGLSVPPAMFQAQMQYLADHGYHVVRLHDAVAAILHHSALPSRPLVLTFDDGYGDFYTQAIPVLLSHGFSATNFVISGRMGWASYMTAAEVQAADQMGFTIGAHTVNHVALAAAAPARALWEMRQSKSTLEGLLGHPVAEFAYPYGSFNAYDETQVRQLGFEAGASTIGGNLHWPAELMHLHRTRVDGGMSLAAYARLVSGPPPSAMEAAIAAGTLASPTVSPVQATPTPHPTAQPTPSPVASATPAASATPLPSPTPAPSATPTPTPVASATPTPAASPSSSP